jgi:hypothetical protein
MTRQPCTGTLYLTPADTAVLLECSDCGWVGFAPDDRHDESLVARSVDEPARLR